MILNKNMYAFFLDFVWRYLLGCGSHCVTELDKQTYISLSVEQGLYSGIRNTFLLNFLREGVIHPKIV